MLVTREWLMHTQDTADSNTTPYCPTLFVTMLYTATDVAVLPADFWMAVFLKLGLIR